jgi:hypothetical protein
LLHILLRVAAAVRNEQFGLNSEQYEPPAEKSTLQLLWGPCLAMGTCQLRLKHAVPMVGVIKFPYILGGRNGPEAENRDYVAARKELRPILAAQLNQHILRRTR